MIVCNFENGVFDCKIAAVSSRMTCLKAADSIQSELVNCVLANSAMAF
jgi:hypothetical protein